ncbi:Acyl transferase/acyl hydrolase/lysophospholipase [Vigna unguiculata]|uniref:Patatin n=1 Tax=Vigna unguiculata TaxID=3917 RepID=A0A4D6MTI8_VIGUN|nr:Acyl transferase/acyl hydrolase/lysophospholipase [Vigna unguiculata]QCE04859.1 Acyl transferase/acyl hydrolase/lysophospholipase [Vigna unguiculata]
MAAFNTPLPPPSYGDKVSILSIDGGGIRGIIPATVLIHLDNALKAKDPTSSLADYFDVISGTSTGGLMSLMLSAPSSPGSNTPLFTPSEVVNFYKTYGPDIFKLRPIWDLTKCPKYDGKFLANKARELLKETRLNQTLTNVVIPSFDEQKIYPVIFSSFKAKTQTYLNAKLSDIGLATSAAPTFLPSHEFENDGVQFDLIDGAMAANNPALVAVSEVFQHSGEKEVLLLSLGTGIPKAKEKLGNIFDIGCQALWLPGHIEVISEVAFSTDMTHYYLATIFPGLVPPKNYLRIEEYNLDPSMEAMDNADKKNMDNLEKVGEGLLTQKVKRINLSSYKPFELDQTNAEAIDRLAEKLFAERQLRLKRKSMEEGGRPFIETI